MQIDGNEFENDNLVELEDESFQRGGLSPRIYWEYIKAGSGPILQLTCIIFTVVSQSLFHGSDYFLTLW